MTDFKGFTSPLDLPPAVAASLSSLVPAFSNPAGLRKLSTATVTVPKFVRDPDGLASGIARCVMGWIVEFEKSLDEESEVGFKYASFAGMEVVHIIDITFFDPHLIRIHGFDSRGERVQVVQHIAQLNVMLQRVPKMAEKPIRIGFYVEPGDGAAESATAPEEATSGEAGATTDT